MSSIEDVLKLKYQKSPQLDYLWRVEMPVLSQYSDPTGAVSSYAQRYLPALSNPTDPSVVSVAGAQELSHRVYEANTPHQSFAVDKSTYATTTTNSAGARELGSLSLVIDEFEDGKTLKYLQTWMSLISNKDLSRNPPVYYKRNIKFIRMNSVHNDIEATTYSGCWPSEINAISNTYDSNGMLQYSVTFQVDFVNTETLSGSSASAEQELLKRKYNGR